MPSRGQPADHLNHGDGAVLPEVRQEARDARDEHMPDPPYEVAPRRPHHDELRVEPQREVSQGTRDGCLEGDEAPGDVGEVDQRRYRILDVPDGTYRPVAYAGFGATNAPTWSGGRTDRSLAKPVKIVSAARSTSTSRVTTAGQTTTLAWEVGG